LIHPCSRKKEKKLNASCHRLAAFITGALLTAAATAADFPSKAVRVIVPFAPGATDVQARFVMDRVAARLGQPFLIEPRGGAGTIIGSDVVAKAAPDGYTLLFTASAVTTLKVLNKQVPFDPERAFAPVSLVSQGFFVAAVSSAVPANTWAEFVTYAKANPGKLNFVSLGRNSVLLMVEALKLQAGIDLVAVPFPGMTPGRLAVVRNDVQLIVDGIADQKALADRGQVKILMYAGPRRAASLPDVPTAAEVGLPNYQAAFWTGLLAPSGTPKVAIDTLSNAVAAAVATPEVQKFYRDQNIEPVGSKAEDFVQRYQADLRRYAEAARAANIQPE